MKDIQIILFPFLFLVSAFSVYRCIVTEKRKSLSFWIIAMLFSIGGMVQEINLTYGFSSKNAIRQAEHYLLKEVGSPRDGWKVSVSGEEKIYGISDNKHFLLKYQHSTHLGFLEAYWTKDKKFTFVDCTEKLLKEKN